MKTDNQTTTKSFAQAAKECNAVTVEVFIDKLHRYVNDHFDKFKAE